MMTRYIAIAALFSAGAATMPATALTVFSDDFEDGNINGWFTLDSDIQTLAHANTGDLFGSTGVLSATVADTENFAVMTTNFTQQTLANAGDFIKLSFNARHNRSTFDDSSLRFGLYDSKGTQVSFDGDLDFDPVSLDDRGYFATVDIGGSTSNVAAQIREEDDDSTGTRLFIGSTFAEIDNDGDPDPIMFGADTDYTYELTLALNADGDYYATLANNETDSTTDVDGFETSPLTQSFDTIYIGTRVPLVDLRIDNVLVEIGNDPNVPLIPEPASVALIGLGGLAAGARRRK